MGNKRNKYLKNLLMGLVISSILSGCDTVEGMRDIKDTQDQLNGIIMQELGVESLVGFNMTGTVLTDVTVVLNAKDVAYKSVPELERIVQSAVKRSFEKEPRAIYIQLATTAE